MEFSDAAILTVMKGVMLVPIEEVYAVYQAAAGGPVWTHQLSSVGKAMRPNMERAFPDLAQINVDGITPENFHEWKEAHLELYTNRRKVKPLGDFARSPHDGIDPDKTIVVTID